MRRFALAALVLFVAACAGDGPTGPVTPPVIPPVVPPVPPPVTPPSADPPAVSREFRGLWVATVANIDWPTRTGLTQTEAMAEMRTILDKAVALRMNAVILHVRASGDALYRSSLEPWAKSLTGTQGGDPGWDPLATWVDEAHLRGLELHAWFNPFRAGNVSDSTKLAANHLWKTRPDLARVWEGQLWFDPGEPDVHTWTLNVIKDVITRYDVDAVHLDDYFYPYPQGSAPVFNDDVSYNKYLAADSAPMARADWRRRNVDTFIQALYTTVHSTRPVVKVGISPFGIWRPGNPAGITGLDAYTAIFADSKKWLENGWVDYFAPQLYWSLASTGQNFTALLDWWISVNSQKRHLWPGLAAYRVADGGFASASEITNQIAVTRFRSGPNAGGGSGTLLYNTTAVRTNAKGLADSLASTGYATNAVVPPYSWLDNIAPATPTIAVTEQNSIMRVTITPGGGEAVRWWMVQWRNATTWNYKLVPGASPLVNLAFSSTAERADVVVVTAFDAAWNASAPVTWRATN
ncbi:MAG: glycoside hydrolase family 10 protein [Gemmatimonadaceae bacterium]